MPGAKAAARRSTAAGSAIGIYPADPLAAGAPSGAKRGAGPAWAGSHLAALGLLALLTEADGCQSG